MSITVLFFATLRDLVGQRTITLSLQSSGDVTLEAVRNRLISQYPDAELNLKTALAAINQEFAFDEDIVADGDEIAFFPPVSGGEQHYPEIYRLPHEPFDHDEIIANITTAETGAVCLFTGIVRGKTMRDGHIPQTDYLEYEAYEPMALAKMQQVAAEIREKFPLIQGIAIIQRLGRLETGQNTVLVACSSGHRDEGCFEGARYGIDRLKEIVPVWKKEIGKNDENWIEGNYTPDVADKSP